MKNNSYPWYRKNRSTTGYKLQSLPGFFHTSRGFPHKAAAEPQTLCCRCRSESELLSCIRHVRQIGSTPDWILFLESVSAMTYDDAGFGTSDAFPLVGGCLMLNNLRPIDDPDAALVDSLRSREGNAFDQLVERYRHRLLRLALPITKNWEDAEEVVQDSLVSVFMHLDGFRGESRFSTWLTRITINQALNLMRKRKGQSVSLDEPVKAEGSTGAREIEACGYSPEQLCAQREFADMVRRLAARVRPSSRQALSLHLEEELSPAEIAQVLSFPVATAKTRVYRGLLDLRKAISPYLPPEIQHRSGFCNA